MAVEVRSVGTIAGNANAITPALPSGWQVGDLLVLFLETANEAVSISIPVSGWTEASNSPVSEAGGATRLTVFWKRAEISDIDPTTSDSGNHQIGRIIAFTGAITSGDPFDVSISSTDTTSDTSGSASGTTTTVANTMVVVACAVGYNAAANGTAFFSGWTNSNLTDLTEQIDNIRTAGNGGGIGVATGGWASIGDYGTTTFTTASSTTKAMWTAAIKPPAVAPLTNQFQNYMGVDGANGISVTEKIR